VDSNRKGTGEITSRQATSADRGFTVISPQKNPFQRMETAASTQAPVDALTPAKNHPDVQTNATSWSPAQQPDSARVIRSKIPNLRYRPFVRHRLVDVKMRLIALWHQSLMPSEKSRGWTLFSNSNQWRRKKISYTAETGH
jgi:hypothetical protein